MNLRRLNLIGVLFCILLITLAVTPHASACAAISSEGYSSENFILAERAVIIWDHPNHIEHFIRQASIQTRSPDLAFLVPTPQTPELAAVDPKIFDLTADVGQPVLVPRVIYHTPWDYVSPMILGLLDDSGEKHRRDRTEIARKVEIAAQTGPRILAEQNVAGYHATVLAAEDSKAIAAWLHSNGFVSTPELDAWIETYVAAKWKITAFKLNKSPNSNDQSSLTTRAIRLSFSTDKPFYPYSEPSDRQNAVAASPLGRALRVAILSNERMAGQLADKKPWPGKLEFAGSSTPIARQLGVTGVLPVSGLNIPLPSSATPKPVWTAEDWLKLAKLDDPQRGNVLPTTLTTFLDDSNPRPGTADLYFSPDANSSPFRGQGIDTNVATIYRTNYANPFADLATLLAVVVIPFAPLYCGLNVLRSRRILRPRILVDPVATQPPSRPLKTILGIASILIGIFYGLQAMGLGVSAFISQTLWVQLNPGAAIILLVSLFLFAFVVLLFWSLVYCGTHVAKTKPFSEKTRRRWTMLCAKGRWEAYMAVFSIFLGSLATIISVFFVIGFIVTEFTGS